MSLTEGMEYVFVGRVFSLDLVNNVSPDQGISIKMISSEPPVLSATYWLRPTNMELKPSIFFTTAVFVLRWVFTGD